MPFKVKAAKARINRLVWSFNGEKLVLHYNAGEKFAQLQEKVDKEGLDDVGLNGQTDDQSLAQLRLQICELLCIVLEDWDVVDDNEAEVPLNAKKMAALGLPIEFYSGLSTAIQEDFQSRGGGTKSRT